MIFLSYGHDHGDETVLATFLARELRAVGHKVFIDLTIPVGTEWGREISKNLKQCGNFVVLISERTLLSEKVQTEVRIAYQRYKDQGTPTILPVRVRYRGELSYELESCLGQFQFTTWETGDDSPRVLSKLLDAIEGRPDYNGLESLRFAAASPPVDPRQPSPAVDPRIFSAPGGTRRDDPFYVRRSADTVLEQRAELVGETVVIKAPRQMGKSSLLLSYLAACEEAGKRTALLDFSGFTEVDLEDYANVLSDIAAFLLREFAIAMPIPRIERQRDLTNYVEDVVLTAVSENIVIAFDEVDRVMGTSYQRDFFTMLRWWHNRRGLSAWSRVDLALVISTEPYLLIDSGNRSPFNVSPPVELASLAAEDCIELNRRYGNPISTAQVGQLYQILGGHPFLTRLAFYRLVTPDRIGFKALMERALEGSEPFNDHLHALLLKLERKPDLLAALRKVVLHRGDPDREAYYRLHSAGLVRRINSQVEPANLLYAHFFEKIL